MIEKVVPNYVASVHDLAVKVNEIIDAVNETIATAGIVAETISGGQPGVDLNKLEGQIKAAKRSRKPKE